MSCSVPHPRQRKTSAQLVGVFRLVVLVKSRERAICQDESFTAQAALQGLPVAFRPLEISSPRLALGEREICGVVLEIVLAAGVASQNREPGNSVLAAGAHRVFCGKMEPNRLPYRRERGDCAADAANESVHHRTRSNGRGVLARRRAEREPGEDLRLGDFSPNASSEARPQGLRATSGAEVCPRACRRSGCGRDPREGPPPSFPGRQNGSCHGLVGRRYGRRSHRAHPRRKAPPEDDRQAPPAAAAECYGASPRRRPRTPPRSG